MSTAILGRPSVIREILSIAISAAAAVTVVVFGICLLASGQSLNIVTWVSWATLDGLICYNQLKSLSNGAWLSGSYTIGAGLVAIASLYNATWHWGVAETITSVGVVLLLALRTRLTARQAIVAGVVILTISTIPLMIDSWFAPYRPSWWMWGITAICDFAMLFMTRKWSLEDSLFSAGGAIVCAIMTVLVLL